MKRLFNAICMPCMFLNNNAYTFISGILLSLSTGTINTLCLEKTAFVRAWHLYASSVLYTVAGALMLYIASRLTAYQAYVTSEKIIDPEERKAIFVDFDGHKEAQWVWIFTALFVTLLGGTVLLFMNYVL